MQNVCSRTDSKIFVCGIHVLLKIFWHIIVVGNGNKSKSSLKDNKFLFRTFFWKEFANSRALASSIEIISLIQRNKGWNVLFKGHFLDLVKVLWSWWYDISNFPTIIRKYVTKYKHYYKEKTVKKFWNSFYLTFFLDRPEDKFRHLKLCCLSLSYFGWPH